MNTCTLEELQKAIDNNDCVYYIDNTTLRNSYIALVEINLSKHKYWIDEDSFLTNGISEFNTKWIVVDKKKWEEQFEKVSFYRPVENIWEIK